MPTESHIAIIGGGPAGLRAAEVAASGGARVTVFDAMPSVGRKFLVAGKSGLNLTNDEALPAFLDRYSGTDLPVEAWRRRFETFDNGDLRRWAASLGVDTFVSAGGKVFPESMKAAPLLRRWVSRLRGLGVTFRMRHRWTGIGEGRQIEFDTPGGLRSEHPDAVVLALGGASWPQTGSDGRWVDTLQRAGVGITPLSPANVGWESDWPPGLIESAEGSPLKNIALHAAGQRTLGELVITRYGLEGAPLYRLGPLIRNSPSPEIEIDLKPTLTQSEIEAKLGGTRSNFVREARRRLNLSLAAAALLKHLPGRGPWRHSSQIAAEIKRCRIRLTRPRPIAEAISSAGGIAWRSIDQQLMLEQLPGVFLAGEMIDWEAPTGGYLLQACFTTGTHAGQAALDWARSQA
ncbi:MAG: NAD(P)/FAD-dependent oxidoreductase [Verrucomicrobiales bacterium]